MNMTLGQEAAKSVRTSDTRWQLPLFRGAGFRNVVLPGSLRVNLVRDGW
jgi:hypothetical protein